MSLSDREHCLIFARPSYGGAPDREIDNSHLAAIMRAANHGIKWAGPICPDREGWREARNHVVSETLQQAAYHKITGVFWVDDDMMVPVTVVEQLLSYGHDFVGALYFQRAAPYLPVAAVLNDKQDFDFWWDFPRNVLAPVDGMGFGCCYTSIELLHAVSLLPECKAGPFTVIDGTPKRYGEDFLFCLRAAKAGFQPYVDTGILCRHHLDSRYADLELFEKFRGALLDPALPGAKAVQAGSDK